MEDSDEEFNRVQENDNLIVFSNCVDRVGWLDLFGIKFRHLYIYIKKQPNLVCSVQWGI